MTKTQLIKIQRRSFDWFKGDGLASLFRDMFPARDKTGDFEIRYLGHFFGKPHSTQRKAREYGWDYDAPLFMTMQMVNRQEQCISEQSVWMCDVPLMTGKGGFIYRGRDTIIASQLVPEPGIYFSSEKDEDGDVVTCSARIVPARGVWLTFDIDEWDTFGVTLGRGRRMPVETLMRAIGCSQQELSHMFKGTCFGDLTLDEDRYEAGEESYVDVFRRARSCDFAVDGERFGYGDQFRDRRLYDLSVTGRGHLNRKLGLTGRPDITVLSKDDVLHCIDYLVCLNSNFPGYAAENQLAEWAGYVGRSAGELLVEHLRVGLWQMQKELLSKAVAEEWMSLSPQDLTNNRPLIRCVRNLFEFGSMPDEFGGLNAFVDRSDELPRCQVPRSHLNDCPGIRFVAYPILFDAPNPN